MTLRLIRVPILANLLQSLPPGALPGDRKVYAQTIRDVNEFITSKKIKGEPVRFQVRASAEALFNPRNAREFEGMRDALKGNTDFGRASEQLDRLEDDLIRRKGVTLPRPNQFAQNGDRSLSCFWTGCVVRAFPDGLVFSLGGTATKPGRAFRGIRPELLEALFVRSKLGGG